MQTVATFAHSNVAIKFELPDLTEYKTESSEYEDGDFDEEEEEEEEEDEEIHYQALSKHDEL